MSPAPLPEGNPTGVKAIAHESTVLEAAAAGEPLLHTSTPSASGHSEAYLVLKQQYDALEEENRKLRLEKPPSSLELSTKIDRQNETIAQLRQEGEALSRKELKLNEIIKKLRASTLNLELSLRDYASKDEESSERMLQVDQILKANLVKSMDQFVEKFNALSQSLKSTSAELAAIREQHWEDKYRELQQLYESELLEKKQALKEVADVSLQLEMAKKQRDLDCELKNTLIAELRREVQGKKKENTEEILRLERKIEALRLESEGGVRDSDPATGVEYGEYAKLSENHHSLQQQYLASQENWKLIEANLTAKIDALNGTVAQLKRTKTKLGNDIRTLQATVSRKSDEAEAHAAEVRNLRAAAEDNRLQRQMNDDHLAETEEKLAKVGQIHAAERTALLDKIAKLSEALDRKRDDLRLSQPNLERQGLSPHPGNWPEIRLGDSAITPSVSRHTSQVFAPRNASLTSLDAEPDDDTFDTSSVMAMEASASLHRNGSDSVSAALPLPGMAAGTGNHIQLLTKMSSAVRRLETELVTVREESAQIDAEKEQLQQELVAKLGLAAENESLRTQVEELRLQIAAAEERAQTMLEVIGEKSDRIYELEADVADLKDICRLQVQQMVEKQGA